MLPAEAGSAGPKLAIDGDAACILELEQVGPGRFRNLYSRFARNDHLYGGQVLAQAFAAASEGMSERQAHSLHGYFLRAGSARESVIYEVEPTRDGARFSSRRVLAKQGERVIFTMECSFHLHEPGFDHQVDMPADVPPPEACPTLAEAADLLGSQIDPVFAQHLRNPSLIETRAVDLAAFVEPTLDARRRFWVRLSSAATTDDPAKHQQLLAYLSDNWFAGTALVPHPIRGPGPDLFIASLDHAMWFHRPARVDDWLLYVSDSPSASGGTGLTRGLLYNGTGMLVASTAQEALLRLRRN